MSYKRLKQQKLKTKRNKLLNIIKQTEFGGKEQHQKRPYRDRQTDGQFVLLVKNPIQALCILLKLPG